MDRITAMAAATLISALGQPITLSTSEIKVWTARAPATMLAETGSDLERRTGHTLDISTGLPDAFMKRAEAGEPFDLMITGSWVIDQ